MTRIRENKQIPKSLKSPKITNNNNNNKVHLNELINANLDIPL